MRSRPVVVLALVGGLLVAACSGGDDGTKDDDGPAVYGVDSTTTTTIVTDPDGVTPAPPTTAGAGTTVRRPSGHAPTGSPSTTATSGGDGGPPATEPAPGSGDVRPTATDDGSQGPPGAFARTLLRPQPATALVLERAAQTGASIAPAAVNRSAGVVAEVAAKPVDVRPQTTLTTTDTDWTADEVRAAADGAAKVAQGSGKAVLRLLLLKGTFEGSQEVLGVAVRGDVLAVFVDNVAGAATPLVSRQAIEDAVLLHELGHVLGLVDLARNTGRADKEHPGHSSNSGSVMYWAVESSLIGQVIGGPPPRDFDADDLADLKALRDGA